MICPIVVSSHLKSSLNKIMPRAITGWLLRDQQMARQSAPGSQIDSDTRLSRADFQVLSWLQRLNYLPNIAQETGSTACVAPIVEGRCLEDRRRLLRHGTDR